MPGLEQQIVEWRKQMLAAGIKSPVPLDELEIHLREEIERQIKSRQNEQQALEIAVQKIGQGKALKTEFKKIGKQKIGRTILLIIGWFAAGIVLWVGWIRFDFDWSLFSFHPNLHFNTIEDIAIIIVAETAICFLAKTSRDLVSHIISLIVCLFLAGNAAIGYYYAAQPSRGIFGGIREPNPLWYRIGMATLLCLPGLFWAWWKWRTIQKRNSKQEQYV